MLYAGECNSPTQFYCADFTLRCIGIVKILGSQNIKPKTTQYTGVEEREIGKIVSDLSPILRSAYVLIYDGESSSRVK